jgi:hypothetical protein
LPPSTPALKLLPGQRGQSQFASGDRQPVAGASNCTCQDQEEAQLEIEEHDEKEPILDLIIAAGMQRIEHYEVAAYSTDVVLAKALGENEIADLAIMPEGLCCKGWRRAA